MNKPFLKFFFIVSYFFTIQLCSMENLKRPYRIQLTTSVIIPCHYKHAHYLYNLIECFSKQSTIIPDEIIISLSGTKNIPSEIIQSINKNSWPFKTSLILSDDNNNEAKNRNIACQKAKGDIIICQDADDFPHPQRIEIIKYFFENYDIVHLLHGMDHDIKNFQIYADFKEIKWLHFERCGMIFDEKIRIANGPASFRRFIFKKVKYDELVTLGVDLRFNNQVYSLFGDRTIVILADIYLYNWALSTYPR